ncbi:MAG: gliding motility-associated C-terminal domain-containing protein [Puia sp.]|nr:gliding motility-associated C-terminal domain-containing protein [Puia sp.]
MPGHLLKFFLFGFCQLLFSGGFAQSQTCPVNSNFSFGTLTHWWAYTGNNKNGNGTASIRDIYDSTNAAPVGTIGAKTIYEYQLSGVPGIQVITSSGVDPFGGFATIPVINGYAYNYSLLLGSTSISHNSGAPGGYTRGISYLINVPPGPAKLPYTMTYAYAMVLENGTHNSNQQPLFSATLKTKDSIITCASPSYYLPTSNNADNRGTGATLNVQEAEAEGFKQSSTPSPNENPNGGGGHLLDVWTKGWREVTFDLSPYRGQQVSLTFEADNCIPGGHFAYAYIALRNSCAGLVISGDTVACINSTLTYSIPALGGGNYSWSFPAGWQVLTNQTDNNIINVIPGTLGGNIIAHEVNGCANLTDTLVVTTSPPTIPGALSGGEPVCAGENTNKLVLSGNQGNVLNWISTTDGFNYQEIPNTGLAYTASNLTETTTFKALVQNGPTCAIDSSSGVTILVYQKSVGGALAPSTYTICKNQDKEANLAVVGETGTVVNWQLSEDGVNWTYFNPVLTDSIYGVNNITVPTDYRVVVKNGVCPADTSSVAVVSYIDVPFPKAEIEPADTLICYGDKAPLNAQIDIGTSYSWTNLATLTNAGDGTVSSTPYFIHPVASPLHSTRYVLSVLNAGCPNARLDTSLVNVTPRIVVNAGNDTAVVFNEPLQWNATSSDTGDTFLWTPATDLNNPDIYDPVGIYAAGTDSVRYVVRATASDGCFGEDTVLVRVFKTLPDIFVPNAFTPGGPTNNVFRPIAVGIAKLRYFKVYNRWGQMMYGTEQMGQGWNGMVSGSIQPTGSYVWMAEGVDYTGKTIFRKGVMVLVR